MGAQSAEVLGDANTSATTGSCSPQERLHHFDIISKFATAVAGLVLSGVIGFATIYSNRQATERQIQAQIDALATQRQAAGAQLAAALLPAIIKTSDAERDIALTILASFAPDQAERIGKLVLTSVKSPGVQQQIKEIIRTSITIKREDEFAQHLENARKYRDFSLHALACREYFRAFENLPVSSRERISKQVQDAKEDYAKGRFAEAAEKLEKASKP